MEKRKNTYIRPSLPLLTGTPLLVHENQFFRIPLLLFEFQALGKEKKNAHSQNLTFPTDCKKKERKALILKWFLLIEKTTMRI